MWIRIIVVALIVLLQLIIPTSAFASTSVNVNVVGRGSTGDAIIDFTVTPVGYNQLDFAWGYSGNTTGIMIRGKYASYPDDIPDIFTEPSDGFLIYSGNGTMSSWYFDENISDLYIKAWGANNNGTWLFEPDTGVKQSMIAFIGLIILAALLSVIPLWKPNMVLAAMASGMWLVLLYYNLNNPFEGMPNGSAGSEALVMVFMVGIVGIPLVTILRQNNDRKQERLQRYEKRIKDGDLSNIETISRGRTNNEGELTESEYRELLRSKLRRRRRV